jgi:hypothetical protein
MPSHEPLPGKCGAALTKGKQGFCINAAGFKTDHVGFGNCYLHGGASKNGRVNGKRLMAVAECEKYGAPIDTDPFTVLAGLLASAWGHQAFFREAAAEHGAIENGKPSVYWVLYQQERAEALKVADTCARVGVNERMIRVLERESEAFITFGQAMLRAAGVDPFSEEARGFLEAGLAALPALEADTE